MLSRDEPPVLSTHVLACIQARLAAQAGLRLRHRDGVLTAHASPIIPTARGSNWRAGGATRRRLGDLSQTCDYLDLGRRSSAFASATRLGMRRRKFRRLICLSAGGTSTVSRLSKADPKCMVRPCVARGLHRAGENGLALMYPASDWSSLCSQPSWLSARLRPC